MTYHNHIHLFVCILLCLGLSCKKYNKLKDVPNPSYLRVFNDIATTPSVLNNGNLNTFLTFILDPVTDKANTPVSGTIVGDYLTSRQLYNISYPTDAANTIAVTGNVNYEYPGGAHVITAPAIGGFDCSSWAEVPSGTHRVIFISRPATSKPFDSLSEVQRSRVLVDTTVNFEPGELYTLEAVLTNLEANSYGAYVRKEEFVHQAYSPDSIYLAVYNLSADINPTDINAYSPFDTWFTDSLQISGAAYTFDYTFLSFDSFPGYTAGQLSVNQRFAGQASYLVFPFPPQSSFFDLQGNLGAYGQFSADPRFNYVAVFNPPVLGTLPFNTVTINSLYSGEAFGVFFWASPVNYNLNYATTVGQAGYEILPNLNVVTTSGGRSAVYPTINLLEIVNDQVYLTQVQKKIPLSTTN